MMKINRPYQNNNLGKLFLVATPIGNLDDISYRAINILKEADIIACEDTRVSLKLLNHFNIKNKKLISLYSQNEINESLKLVKEIKEKNLKCVYISDAGTPGISDPGSILVSTCYKYDVPVSSIPGPCALISAFIISNIDTSDFRFYGFLPTKSNALTSFLVKLKYALEPLIFYESPLRVIKTLLIMKKVFGGNRNISIIRELTKIHEEVLNGTIEEIINSNPLIKGECIIIVDKSNNIENENIDLDKLIQNEKENDLSKSELAKKLHELTGISKKIIYNKLVESEVNSEK